MTEQVINPFDVQGGTDADGNPLPLDNEKMIRDFGASPITQDLIDRFEKVTGKRAHRFMRRGLVVSHRDLTTILDRYEKNEPFYLYTGRGPSSDSMHVGHATPFDFTLYLQEAFDCPLVIMLTDDEKYLHNEKLTLEDVKRFSRENAKDIIALGFDVKKTFIFINSELITSSPAFYENVLKMERRTTMNQITGTFGFDGSTNIGKYAYPAKQSAPAFATSFPHIFGGDALKTRNIPCLVPCAIDQDPYFRQCRDNAPKLKYKKPSLIHSTFLPSLEGAHKKMSASKPMSAVFLSDTPKQIKKKVGSAISGGQQFEEDHRRLGGRTEIDMPYQYLRFFLEDDAELKELHDSYEKGDLMTGQMKARCTEVLQEYVSAFQERRSKVTDQVLGDFFAKKPLEYGLKTAAKDKPEAEQVEQAAAPQGHKKSMSIGKSKIEPEAEQVEKAAAPQGHKKSMSIGKSKIEVEETRETSANGQVKGHVKKMSMSKSP